VDEPWFPRARAEILALSKRSDWRGLANLEMLAERLLAEARFSRREIELADSRSQTHGPARSVERNITPAAAAERLAISKKMLSRLRFTTYRSICIPLEDRTRGYVVSERLLDEFIARQRTER
jgi:hypothetical protein